MEQLAQDMKFSLGARLAACASFVREGKVAADIGTDHAYLPIWLVGSGRIPRAYASDINEEPLHLANQNITAHELSDKIITFTANGLAKIPSDAVDDIIIAGMGGDNIAGILQAVGWVKNPRYRLILQPMSHVERLREYLYTQHFAIPEERPICEANRVYTVICAEYSDNAPPYTEFDYHVGALPRDNPDARKLIRRQAGIVRSMADGLAAKGDEDGAAHMRALWKQLDDCAKGKEG